MKNSIVIGTRGSKLALVQAEMVRALVGGEIKIIKTSGDIHADKSLKDIGGKELFTKEIDEALIRGEVDIAVHSLKDVPAIIPDALVIAATLERENPLDCLIGAKNLAELPQGGVVGTSSPRRRAQLLHLRPDLKIIEYRGNVTTRIEKLASVDATILAAAGLNRLGLKQYVNEISPEQMLPSAAQGIIGIAARKNDEKILQMLQKLNHEASFIAATAERAVLKEYGGNCYTPIAAYAQIQNGQIFLEGYISSYDGKKSFRINGEALVADAGKLGTELGRKLKDLL